MPSRLEEPSLRLPNFPLPCFLAEKTKIHYRQKAIIVYRNGKVFRRLAAQPHAALIRKAAFDL